MKIAIVEDEKDWQVAIKKVIMNYFQDDIEVIISNSGEQFLARNENYQIVFMDVELKGEDGFSTSSQYKKKYPDSIIIILTTHNEWCSKGYQVEAFRYIDKLKMEEIKEALDSACKKIYRRQKIKLHIILQGEILIAYEDILYFETCGHNVCMHTIKEKYECKESITILAEKLKERGFYYIHRSFLVNMDYITTFNRKGIVMLNGDCVLVSIRKFKDFKRVYIKWKFEGRAWEK